MIYVTGTNGKFLNTVEQLSPQVRGKRYSRAILVIAVRLIPAGAGKTPVNVYRVVVVRLIPAGAGKTIRSHRMLL